MCSADARQPDNLPGLVAQRLFGSQMPAVIALWIDIRFLVLDQRFPRLHEVLFVSIELLRQFPRMKVEVGLAYDVMWVRYHAQVLPILDIVENNAALPVLNVYGVRQAVYQ